MPKRAVSGRPTKSIAASTPPALFSRTSFTASGQALSTVQAAPAPAAVFRLFVLARVGDAHGAGEDGTRDGEALKPDATGADQEEALVLSRDAGLPDGAVGRDARAGVGGRELLRHAVERDEVAGIGHITRSL